MYAELADIPRFGIPTTAFGTLSTDQKQAGLNSAGATMNGYFRGRYPSGSDPTVAMFLDWGDDLRECEVVLAAWTSMHVRGFNPAAGADTGFKVRRDEWTEWLNKVQRQAVHPNVTLIASAIVQPLVQSVSVVNLASGATAASRGW